MDAPTADPTSVTTNEDTATTIDLAALGHDVDGDPLTVDIATPPAHGTLVDNLDGTYTYTPATNYNGADQFTYTVTDPSNATSSAATVSITVTAVSDAPTADPTSVTTNEDTATTIDLAALGHDVDGDPLTVDIATPPAHCSADCSALTSATATRR